MSIELQNKKLMNRFYTDVITNKRLELIDVLMDTDFFDHNRPNLPDLAPGRTGLRQMFKNYLNAFPNMKVTVDNMIAEGDFVASRVIMTGTHKGEFMGIKATNKDCMVTLTELCRFSNGRCLERWGNWDELDLMRQLGALPATK